MTAPSVDRNLVINVFQPSLTTSFRKLGCISVTTLECAPLYYMPYVKTTGISHAPCLRITPSNGVHSPCIVGFHHAEPESKISKGRDAQSVTWCVDR